MCFKARHISLQRGMSTYALFRNKKKYNCTNYMQVRLMRLMSKVKYLIVPKGTKFTGSGKLGLRNIYWNVYLNTWRYICIIICSLTVKHFDKSVCRCINGTFKFFCLLLKTHRTLHIPLPPPRIHSELMCSLLTESQWTHFCFQIISLKT